MASSGQVSFLLHRPRSLDNVGAVARVVKNFGLGRLWLVDPLSYSFDKALKLAVGAEDVVRDVFVEKGLGTALEGFVFSAGTTSREIEGRRALHPRELLARVAQANGPCAIVFGEEKRGLSDAELALCQEVCRIPSDAAQPSLNLAQACAVTAYALSGEAAAVAAPEPAATQEELHRLRERLKEALDLADFLNPQAPDHILIELLRPWERAQLSKREQELWGNALRKLRLGLEGKTGRGK